MKVISVNIGKEREQQRKDGVEITGIYKFPANAPVFLGREGIPEDAVCDKEHHGGPDQAIYVYGGADYEWWEGELGQKLAPGTFGENLTISELESAVFNAGDVLRVGEAVLQVSAPRIPCGTFAARMQDPQWVKKFRQAERPGLYCRVLKEGKVAAGDFAQAEKYAGSAVSIPQIYRAYYQKEKTEDALRVLLNAPISIRLRIKFEKELEALRQEKL